MKFVPLSLVIVFANLFVAAAMYGLVPANQASLAAVCLLLIEFVISMAIALQEDRKNDAI